MSQHNRSFKSSWLVAAIGTLSLALAGCSDGVALNGGIFDALGVSQASQAAAKKEPNMPSRSGLVLPPDQTRLPEPGVGGAPEQSLAGLSDPEQTKAANEAERARLHKAYCSGELNWKERAFDADVQNKSPFGPCGGLSGMLNNN